MTSCNTTAAMAAPPREYASRDLVADLRGLALRNLKRMYRPEEQAFGFCIRRGRQGDALEGMSLRYTAIALIGLSGESPETAREVLGGHHPVAVCGRLLDRVSRSEDLGEVALTLWAARLLDCPDSAKALHRLRLMNPAIRPYPTVELAWVLSALTVDGPAGRDQNLERAIAHRLMASFQDRASLFPHRIGDNSASLLRRHVACFADQVYPIQALSFFYARTGSPRALDAATRCAERICQVQGTGGQWWWHYDIRTGKVVEGYPVYSVHQDAMAPMALLALQKINGRDYGAHVDKGLSWLADPPEGTSPLIDAEADLIWRKVARREPIRLVRGMQTLACRLYPALRVPGLDRVLRPRVIDYECRPYHMGWILYAWPGPDRA